jgi:hypothetical protein
MEWFNSYTYVQRDADETNGYFRRMYQQVSIGGIHILVCRIVTSMGLECLCTYMRRGKQSVPTTRRAIGTDSPPQCFQSASSTQPTATAMLPLLTDKTDGRPSPHRSHTRRHPRIHTNTQKAVRRIYNSNMPRAHHRYCSHTAVIASAVSTFIESIVRSFHRRPWRSSRSLAATASTD